MDLRRLRRGNFTGYPFTGSALDGYPFTGYKFGEEISSVDMAFVYNSGVPDYATYTRAGTGYSIGADGSSVAVAQDVPMYDLSYGRTNLLAGTVTTGGPEWTDEGDGTYSCDGTQSSISGVSWDTTKILDGILVVVEGLVVSVDSGALYFYLEAGGDPVVITTPGTYTFYQTGPYPVGQDTLDIFCSADFVGRFGLVSAYDVTDTGGTSGKKYLNYADPNEPSGFPSGVNQPYLSLQARDIDSELSRKPWVKDGISYGLDGLLEGVKTKLYLIENGLPTYDDAYTFERDSISYDIDGNEVAVDTPVIDSIDGRYYYRHMGAVTNKCVCDGIFTDNTTGVIPLACNISIVDGGYCRLENNTETTLYPYINGQVANLNPHSWKIIARTGLGHTSFVRLSGGDPGVLTTEYSEVGDENVTPSATNKTLFFNIYPGEWVEFQLPQLTETKYQMPTIPSSADGPVTITSSAADSGTNGLQFPLYDETEQPYTGKSSGITLETGSLTVGNAYEIIATTADYFGAGLVAGDRFTATSALTLSASNSVQAVLPKLVPQPWQFLTDDGVWKNAGLLERLGGNADSALITTGTLTIGILYQIEATTTDYFGSGLVVGDRFTATAETVLSESNSVRTISPASGRLTMKIRPGFDGVLYETSSIPIQICGFPANSMAYIRADRGEVWSYDKTNVIKKAWSFFANTNHIIELAWSGNRSKAWFEINGTKGTEYAFDGSFDPTEFLKMFYANEELFWVEYMYFEGLAESPAAATGTFILEKFTLHELGTLVPLVTDNAGTTNYFWIDTSGYLKMSDGTNTATSASPLVLDETTDFQFSWNGESGEMWITTLGTWSGTTYTEINEKSVIATFDGAFPDVGNYARYAYESSKYHTVRNAYFDDDLSFFYSTDEDGSYLYDEDGAIIIEYI